MTHIEVHPSGTFVDLNRPEPDTIHIGDIAQHLSHICRFNGGSNKFYSVAEHSYRVAAILESAGEPLHVVFAALLHDAHEAYIGDLTTPWKQLLGSRYAEATWRFDLAICKRYNMDIRDMRCREVKLADSVMLATEAYWLTASRGEGEHWSRLPMPDEDELQRLRPACVDPERARDHFLGWFNRLQARMLYSVEYPQFSPSYYAG